MDMVNAMDTPTGWKIRMAICFEIQSMAKCMWISDHHIAFIKISTLLGWLLNVLILRKKSIYKVGLWCWVRSPGVQSWTEHCAQGQCHAGTGSGLLVLVKWNINATAYKVILYNCVQTTLWQQFREEPRMGVDSQVPAAVGHYNR